MATITLHSPAARRVLITVVPNPALIAFLAHNGYTVLRSIPQH